MKVLICLAVSLALASAIPYPTKMSSGPDSSSSYPSTNDGYEEPAPSYGTAPAPSYGGTTSRTQCTPYFDTITKRSCEPYTERTCHTNHQENCQDVAGHNCRALWKSSQDRKCFEITEKHCSLKESVEFESVQVGFTVQKCHKVPERVCDTVFETESSTREISSCVDIENPTCSSTDRTVYDKTCRTFTVFDCQQTTSSGYGGSSSGGSSSGSSYGGDSSSSHNMDSGSSYGNANDYSAPAPTNSYAAPAPTTPKCNRREETKCYKTPRVVHQQQCVSRHEKVCEKTNVAVPSVKERTNCRNEDKKVCVLEERTQPKQVKKYVYTKQCRNVPRKVCANSDQKTLVPSCVGTTRKTCSYSPVEQCDEMPKEHCFNVDHQVRKERCETVQEPTPSVAYGEPHPHPTPSYE